MPRWWRASRCRRRHERSRPRLPHDHARRGDVAARARAGPPGGRGARDARGRGAGRGGGLAVGGPALAARAARRGVVARGRHADARAPGRARRRVVRKDDPVRPATPAGSRCCPTGWRAIAWSRSMRAAPGPWAGPWTRHGPSPGAFAMPSPHLSRARARHPRHPALRLLARARRRGACSWPRGSPPRSRGCSRRWPPGGSSTAPFPRARVRSPRRSWPGSRPRASR